MNQKGKKLEPKLRLDMSFEEAMSRFAATKPDEVEESVRRAKGKRPPGNGPPRRPARSNEHGKSSPSGRHRKPSGD